MTSSLATGECVALVALDMTGQPSQQAYCVPSLTPLWHSVEPNTTQQQVALSLRGEGQAGGSFRQPQGRCRWLAWHHRQATAQEEAAGEGCEPCC